MTYGHGVKVTEQATSIVPAVEVSAGLPVVVGCAPVHLLDETGPVNQPVLISSYKEAVTNLGYSSDFSKWNLCEFMYAMFALFAVTPAVFINVFDPDTHNTEVEDESVTLDGDEGTTAYVGLIAGTVTVKDSTGETTYTEDTDYSLDRETGTITLVDGGSIAEDATLTVSYAYADPSQVDSDDIIGGIDSGTGAASGLELIDSVFPMFGLVPGSIVSPGYSTASGVAAVMHAKAGNINGHFKALAVVDIDSDTVTRYDEVSAEKNTNNLVDNQLVVCWPKVSLDGVEFWMSSQVTALMCQVDSENNDVPYVSPSNKSLQMDAAVANSESVWLGLDSANYLNGQGIVTALNFYGGWKCWGNRTGCVPLQYGCKGCLYPHSQNVQLDCQYPDSYLLAEGGLSHQPALD